MSQQWSNICSLLLQAANSGSMPNSAVPFSPTLAQAAWYEQMTIAGNELWRVGALFLSIFGGWVLGRLARALMGRAANRLEVKKPYWSATLLALGRAVVPALIVLGLKLGLEFVVMLAVVRQVAETVMAVLVTLSVGFAFWCLVDVADVWMRRFTQRTDSKLDDMLQPLIRASLRVTVVVLLLVQIATILSDKPVTSIIAGLGVGGLAVGLAAQDTIKNFFGSLMIFTDRPFELGERIQVDGFDGAVESVGFRSTSIRTLDGHRVTIPNGELANKSICNIANRPNIKRAMNLGLTYDTTPEKVQQAIEIVRDVLANHEGMQPDSPPRVFFNEFQDSALNLSVIYWYHPPDWWSYCAFNERVNMEILQRFNDAGIEFAFPTQTVHLAGETG